MIPFKSALGNEGGREDAIKANLCIALPLGCGKPVTSFEDRDSYREYLITGMCQGCQDEFYETYQHQEHGYCDAFNPCASPEYGSCPFEATREANLNWANTPPVSGVVPSDDDHDSGLRATGAPGQQEVHGAHVRWEIHHAGEQQQGGSVA